LRGSEEGEREYGGERGRSSFMAYFLSSMDEKMDGILLRWKA